MPTINDSTSTKPEISTQAPLTRAIVSFLSDLKQNEDVKSPFYKEILYQISSLLLQDSSPEQTRRCADGLSTFIADLDRQKRASKTMRFAEKLRPLIAGLSQYTSAMDVVIQAGPAPALVIYGGARLVLQQAREFYSCFDTVLEIMARIGHLLQVYELFSAAYSSSPQMLDLLVQSYKNIVGFWQKASKLLSRKTYKLLPIGLVKSLDAEWQKCYATLDQDCTQVQTLAQATEADIRRQRELEHANKQEDKKRRAIVEWIRAGEDESTSDMRVHLRERLKTHHLGTCTWLYEDMNFKTWYSASTNKAIWYHAEPGTGKTILSSVLTKYLQDQLLEGKRLKTSYFSFSFNDPYRRQAISAIRSLALQVLMQLDTIPNSVLNLYETEMANYAFALRDINTAVLVLKALLRQTDRFHVIVDGLDECLDRPDMSSSFAQLVSTDTLGIVKWFFTSRTDYYAQQLAKQVDASEIIPDLKVIMGDIRIYLQDRLLVSGHVNHCINQWTATSGGNFLWVSLNLRTLTGVDLNCDEDIEEELKKFPKDLTGCYLRTLETLTLCSEYHQELAGRIFTILVVATQPLHLSELLNALSTRNGAHDYSRKRAPNPQRVEELCGALLTFDRISKGSQDDPLIKLAHKSIQDFFLEDPKCHNIPNNLSRFFVNPDAANQEIGLVCLTYLNYARYQKPTIVSEILTNDPESEHAFLKYAARFWFQHLMHTNHSSSLFSTIEKFVHSPAFWTCMTVQSNIAPHLFSRLVECKKGRFALSTMVSRGVEDRTSYSVPLPDWLDQYGASGADIIQRYLAFVKEWFPVLTTYPHAINQCIGDIIGRRDFPCRHPSVKQSIQVFGVTQFETGVANQYLGRITSDQEGLHAMILESSEIYLKGDIKIKYISNLSDKSSDSKLVHKLTVPSIQSSNDLHVIIKEDNKYPLVWFLDPDNLYLTEYHTSCSKSHEPPHNLATPDGEVESFRKVPNWVISAKSVGRTRTGEAVAYHCLKHDRCEKEDDESSSESEESDSDSDSDSDSGYVSKSVSSNGIDANHEASDCHCLAIVHQEGPPIWSQWKTKSKTRLQYSCAFHPIEPIAVWSSTPYELSVVNLCTGQVKIKILPEPVEVQSLSAAAICKELHFSSCGKFLFYFLCSFIADGVGITCSISVSLFEFKTIGTDFEPLSRSFPAKHISYQTSESVKSLSPPFILTTWIQQTLYVALPTLSCNPKVIRVQFHHPTNMKDITISPFQTLRSPIYFPSSTPYRNPKILIHKSPLYSPSNTSKPSEYIVLSLNRDQTQKLDNNSEHLTLPLIVITWPISEASSWREWKKELDERSEDMKISQKASVMLRGTFVDSEKRYNMPIRSGLNWRKKAFVTCS